MGQDFFTNLPSEISIDILLRLPFQTIIRCRRVCKSWLHLIETRDFGRLSKSVPVLMFCQWLKCSQWCTIYEFADALNHDQSDLHYNPITKTNLRVHELIPGYRAFIKSSANGLLFLLDYTAFFICNPITREYIKLPCLQDFYEKYPQIPTYGFGVSQMSGQHKVVKLSCYRINEETRIKARMFKSRCHVYTLGTGSWRSIKHCVRFKLSSCTIGPVFLNGYLHWLLHFPRRPAQISLFDLETEVFSIFSTPSPPKHILGMSVLGDCLCLCDNTSEDELVIWLLKEYRNEKSWTKEYVIKKGSNYLGEGYSLDLVFPIKLFENGDILMSMSWGNPFLVYYSNKSKSIWKIKLSKPGNVDAIFHTPSFISLKSFMMENVIQL